MISRAARAGTTRTTWTRPGDCEEEPTRATAAGAGATEDVVRADCAKTEYESGQIFETPCRIERDEPTGDPGETSVDVADSGRGERGDTGRARQGASEAAERTVDGQREDMREEAADKAYRGMRDAQQKRGSNRVETSGDIPQNQ